MGSVDPGEREDIAKEEMSGVGVLQGGLSVFQNLSDLNRKFDGRAKFKRTSN